MEAWIGDKLEDTWIRGQVEVWVGDKLDDTWIGGRMEVWIGDRLEDTWIGGHIQGDTWNETRGRRHMARHWKGTLNRRQI